MIVWLASYPRSGNTLLRMILKSVFGKQTYSKYNDLSDIGADPKMMELVGHRMFEGEWATAYRNMAESDDLFFVKTHDGPEDDAKAICIVRDGRAATVSFRHYLKDFAHKEHPITDIIVGFDQFGSWGSHLDAWEPLRRPNTLFVRYEDLLVHPEDECARIANFLGLDIVGQWRNDFEAFQKVNPSFFRKGNKETAREELTGDDLDIFWLFHRDWMETLGYASGDEVLKYNFKILREIPHRTYSEFQDLLKQKNDFMRSELGKLSDLLKQKDDLLKQKNDFMRSELGKLNDLLKQKDELLKQQNDLMKSELTKLSDLLKQKDEQFRQKCGELIEVDNQFKAKCLEVASKDQEFIRVCQEHDAERQRLAEECKQLHEGIRQREERIAVLLNSWSWKVTKPLRTIAGVLAKKG